MKSNLDQLAVVVPARLGSNRVRAKNLRLLNGKPLISYILETLKQTKYLRNIYINSDSDLFAEVAADNDVLFYKRKASLATSESLIDEYLYDFMKFKGCSHLAVVNPTSPFIDAPQLDNAWDQYVSSDCDTLLSCERIQTHCFLEGKAINFSANGKHPRSQDITPVLALNFAISIWDCEKFIHNYENNGFGVYTGKIHFFETSGWAGIDIDYPDDFELAEVVGKLLDSNYKATEDYPSFVVEYLRKNPNIQN
jgi:CMP-N-acetylneuraminic acid synthetase